MLNKIIDLQTLRPFNWRKCFWHYGNKRRCHLSLWRYMHNSNWDWPVSCVTGNDVDCCYELRPILTLCTGNYWLYVDTIYRTLYMYPRPSSNGVALQWCHNGRDGVSNQQPNDFFLLRRLFWRRSKNTSKLCVTGLYRSIQTQKCIYMGHLKIYHLVPQQLLLWNKLITEFDKVN